MSCYLNLVDLALVACANSVLDDLIILLLFFLLGLSTSHNVENHFNILLSYY